MAGYKDPPKHAQFKKGQSGNPNGRPKGTRNLKTDLLEELSEKIPITERGKQRKVSKQRAMIKALMANAVQGDTKSANVLLNMLLKFVPQDDEAALSMDDLTATDIAILEDYEAKILKGETK